MTPDDKARAPEADEPEGEFIARVRRNWAEHIAPAEADHARLVVLASRHANLVQCLASARRELAALRTPPAPQAEPAPTMAEIRTERNLNYLRAVVDSLLVSKFTEQIQADFRHALDELSTALSPVEQAGGSLTDAARDVLAEPRP